MLWIISLVCFLAAAYINKKAERLAALLLAIGVAALLAAVCAASPSSWI